MTFYVFSVVENVNVYYQRLLTFVILKNSFINVHYYFWTFKFNASVQKYDEDRHAQF